LIKANSLTISKTKDAQTPFYFYSGSIIIFNVQLIDWFFCTLSQEGQSWRTLRFTVSNLSSLCSLPFRSVNPPRQGHVQPSKASTRQSKLTNTWTLVAHDSKQQHTPATFPEGSPIQTEEGSERFISTHPG